MALAPPVGRCRPTLSSFYQQLPDDQIVVQDRRRQPGDRPPDRHPQALAVRRPRQWRRSSPPRSRPRAPARDRRPRRRRRRRARHVAWPGSQYVQLAEEADAGHASMGALSSRPRTPAPTRSCSPRRPRRRSRRTSTMSPIPTSSTPSSATPLMPDAQATGARRPTRGCSPISSGSARSPTRAASWSSIRATRC